MVKQIPYVYKNAPIPGGGYVTGFLFDKTHPGVLFCRTDIGGTYRYEAEKDRWKSLIDHVTMEKLDETYPAAIAVDGKTEGKIYIICGVDHKEKGVLAVSEDYGNTFVYREVPTSVHGNWNGRGTGYRLVCQKGVLYFASQKGGLFISRDEGRSWKQTGICGEEYLTFVWASPVKQGMLVVGTAGVTTGDREGLRGPSLYVSYDEGNSFEVLLQPESKQIPESKWSGFVGQRYDYDGTYLYVTMANTGQYSYVTELGYSCDSGDTLGGMVLRYSFGEDGSITGYEDITPYNTICEGNREEEKKEGMLPYGFSGISSCQKQPGLLVCSTICKGDGDMIYRSLDYGTTWECILYDLNIGKLDFRTSYMRPEHNGGHSLLHWLSDIKIDPYDQDTAWFNSGTGVFRTKNLTADEVVFSDWCDGIEETVHLNVYSPNGSPVQVIDIVGDLGGFAFHDLSKPCRNSFDDKDGNRYITCINADYSEKKPECFVVTPRGNWKGKTKGGLILTKDAGVTFERLPMPFGLTEKLDKLLKDIERPNVNSGWVAMSPDCRNIVWSVADCISLQADCVVASHDGGATFRKVTVYDTADKPVDAERGFKAFSDRVKDHLFYGFGEASQFYISKDGGENFYEKPLPEDFPVADFHLIDCANKTEIRGDGGRSGIFYIALAGSGLWKLSYNEATDSVSVECLTKEGESVYRVGLGVKIPGGEYLGEDKAVYMCGVIEGQYGFYRSFDDAKTWERINTEKQMFGEINSIDADSRTFGRFYLATGSRGLIYGEEINENI